MKTYYLSFSDNKLPHGKRWIGAAIVRAQDFEGAVRRAWVTGCNPGGDVYGIIVRVFLPSEKWYDRLLTKDDLFEMGQELVEDNNLPDECNALVDPTGKLVPWKQKEELN